MSDEVEPVYEITEPKHTIGFWCQKGRPEEASCANNQRRERNEIVRLVNVPETSKSDRARGEAHVKLLDHARNIARDRVVDLKRDDSTVTFDVKECMKADMSSIC